MISVALFWFAMGLLFVLIAFSAKTWSEDLGLKMTWWKWLLTALWYAYINVSVALAMTFLGENEPDAAWRSILFFGVIGIILGVGLWRVLWLGRQAKSV